MPMTTHQTRCEGMNSSRAASPHMKPACARGVDLWEFVHQAVLAWIDKTTPPSLLPKPLAVVPTG